ncbi:MAG: HslU--HslV peptidase proteolytic subunit, partial [Clostridiales bacterium]|nr:HslU--HslV peptidase proteolytic subunit [Clostridiales bacterium]
MEGTFRGTTICAVKKDGKIVVAGDGQVTLQNSIIFKNNSKKVRRIYDN